jgi:hypothetical protein
MKTMSSKPPVHVDDTLTKRIAGNNSMTFPKDLGGKIPVIPEK